MNRPARSPLGPLLLAGALLLAAGACGSGGVTVGGSSGAAPALSGTTIAGATWDLRAQRGRWVVVAFQASTCIPCRKELPGMRTFAAAHPAVRMVSVGLAETAQDFSSFLAPFHVPWPAIADRQGYISDRWRVESLPVTVVVDPEGRIRHRFGTEVSPAALARVVA